MEVATHSHKLRFFLVACTIITGGALAATGFLWAKLHKIEMAVQGPTDETATVITAVGRYLILPQGETPELLTVDNLEQVKSQPFFANAALGDKVLVYRQSAKAILWRPAADKIVEVYPINLSAQ